MMIFTVGTDLEQKVSQQVNIVNKNANSILNCIQDGLKSHFKVKKKKKKKA